MLLNSILITLLPAILIYAAISDVVTLTIPNWLNGVTVLLFFPAFFLAHLGLPYLMMSIGLGFAVLCVGIAFFALGYIGGGDAKLLAACSLWIGWPQVLPFFVWAAVAGGGLALLVISLRKSVVAWPIIGVVLHYPWLKKLLEPKGGVPYGVAIAIGGLVTFPDSPISLVLQHSLIKP